MTIVAPAPAKGDFSKVADKTAQAVIDRYPVQLAKLKPLIQAPTMTSLAFFQFLTTEKKYRDAITFLSYALPRKETVMWASHCAKITGAKGDKLPSPLPQAQQAAVQTVQKWLMAQSDETRRATQPAAEAATYGTPAGATALATFLSGGSVGPPDIPTPIPPPEHACAHAASNAIFLASVVINPQFAAEKFKRYLDDGFAIASGRTPDYTPLEK